MVHHCRLSIRLMTQKQGILHDTYDGSTVEAAGPFRVRCQPIVAAGPGKIFAADFFNEAWQLVRE